jgi:uncharacterized protein (DUF2384 family)
MESGLALEGAENAMGSRANGKTPVLRRALSSGGSRAANAYDAPRKHGLSIAGEGEIAKPRYSLSDGCCGFQKNTNLLINGENFMGAKPLAEAYERLKELRRQGDMRGESESRIGHQLRAMYDDVVRQGVPDRYAELIRKLDAPSKASGGEDYRVLEIKTLADRVFGDEEKADAWLRRPNHLLAGQRPADLLKDELGAAVAREMLEQIDHGIFA